MPAAGLAAQPNGNNTRARHEQVYGGGVEFQPQSVGFTPAGLDPFGELSPDCPRSEDFFPPSTTELGTTLPPDLRGTSVRSFESHFPEVIVSRSAASRFQFLPHKNGAILDEFLMLRGECGREVAVDIEFADHLPAGKHGNDDLRFGFE
jgi:hypothetical protein